MLIADDDVGFRETLCSVFERRGFEVFQAGDGLEAVGIVRSRRVNIALFDFQMPRLTGLEAIRQARLILPQMPCVLMSATLDDAIRREAMRLAEPPISVPSLLLTDRTQTLSNTPGGAPIRVLSKPVPLRQILEIVDALCETVRTSVPENS